jgi:hypothetical protein
MEDPFGREPILKKKNDRILNHHIKSLYQSASEKMIDYAGNYIREFKKLD